MNDTSVSRLRGKTFTIANRPILPMPILIADRIPRAGADRLYGELIEVTVSYVAGSLPAPIVPPGRPGMARDGISVLRAPYRLRVAINRAQRLNDLEGRRAR